MYAAVSGALKSLYRSGSGEFMAALTGEMKRKEEYADEMREVLTGFIIECTGELLNRRTENRVSGLLRIIADLEDMSDDCYSISLLLERSVRKNQIFRSKEMEALEPYVALVEDFLNLLQDCLGRRFTEEEWERARSMEELIAKSRDRLRRLARKRIEAGADVKTELLFIDLVKRIEKLGDYCYNIMRILFRTNAEAGGGRRPAQGR
jgi:phosphate:Na+ symporter